MTCKKCGASVTEDQAFCPKCGAVIGMEKARPQQDATPNLASTIAIKDFKLPPLPKQTPPATKERTSSASPAPAAAPRPEPPRDIRPPVPDEGRSNTALFVIIGFIVVLLIGGLLLLLLYLFLGG